jgi:hypothetical protein
MQRAAFLPTSETDRMFQYIAALTGSFSTFMTRNRVLVKK